MTEILRYVIMGVELCENPNEIEIPIIVQLKELSEENLEQLREHGMKIEDVLKYTNHAYGTIKYKHLRKLLELDIVQEINFNVEVRIQQR